MSALPPTADIPQVRRPKTANSGHLIQLDAHSMPDATDEIVVPAFPASIADKSLSAPHVSNAALMLDGCSGSCGRSSPDRTSRSQRPFVDQTIVHAPRLVVTDVERLEKLSTETRRELVQGVGDGIHCFSFLRSSGRPRSAPRRNAISQPESAE